MNLDFNESGISGYEKEFLNCTDRDYLDRFWLNADILSESWANILERSFVVRGKNVSIVPTKEIDVRVGGLLFVEDEFEEFKRLASQSGAMKFVVIENIGQRSWKHLTDRCFFRFSYPLSVTWGEMAESCAIADDVFMRPIRSYFVVTDNGQVGKYADNDADRPYDLIFMDVPHKVE